MKWKYFVVVVCQALVLNLCAQIPAFPGAQGWGAGSVGGRGGAVIEVTNLNDAGPGSFRAAVSASGPRTVVFRTGGIINLLTEIQVTNPYIYIAAQTAPGDGIVLKNLGISVFTHDVIIRGLRIRPGDDLPALSANNRDCIVVQPGSYNVIIDHCSFSWASDENMSILGTGVNSVTVQWCIVSEGLYANINPKGAHSMGVLVGYGAQKVSLHHNLFAHNGARNPLFSGMTDHEFVNNLVYDWLVKAELQEQGATFKIDFQANYYKPRSYNSFPELPLGIDFDSTTVFGSRMYMPGNYFSAGTAFITPQQLAQLKGNAVLFSNASLQSKTSTIGKQSASAAYDTVLQWVGALHPQRDVTDKRVLKNVSDSTGGILDCIHTPILLDSGSVISATDSTIVYSQKGKAYYYSTESRRIEITSGTGAGQVRYGAPGITVLDTQNVILQGKVTQKWNPKPDATSKYKFYAGCNNTLGSYPAYAPGVAPADADKDGMPDAWEASKGLNPGNASDRNNTNLDTSGKGYTNLEVYLNGLYTGLTTGIADHSSTQSIALNVYPNPFSTQAVAYSPRMINNGRLVIYDLLGKPVREIPSVSGHAVLLQRDRLPSGLYFLHLMENGKIIAVEKLFITAE